MFAGRAVEVNNRLPNDFAIGNFDGDVVERSEPRRAPVDLDHFGMAIVDDEPIAVNERFAGLQSDARDDIAKKILHRKTKDDCSNAGRDEQAFDGLIVANVQNQKDCDEDDGCVDNFSQEFRDRNPMALLEVEFEKIAIQQSDEKGCAQDNDRRAEMVQKSPGQLEVARGCIDCQAGSEQVIKHAQTNAMFALEPAPAQNQQAINPGKGQREQEVFVTFGQLRHHADANSLPLNGQLTQKIRHSGGGRDREP